MMKLRGFCVAVSLAVFFVLSGLFELGLCMGQDKIINMKVGAIRDSKGTPDSSDIDSLGRFAIQEHNKKQNVLLEFTRVLKAKEQVVAGKMYYLTLEAIHAGKKNIYEAKIWVKPWLNFKQLQEFKLGVKEERHKLGWCEVPIHAPEVKDAANYAVKSIAQRSNSLSPYELLEVVLAKGKVIEDYIKFNLLLKVRRGIKEERFRVEVNKKLGGEFFVSWMEQDRT